MSDPHYKIALLIYPYSLKRQLAKLVNGAAIQSETRDKFGVHIGTPIFHVKHTVIFSIYLRPPKHESIPTYYI